MVEGPNDKHVVQHICQLDQSIPPFSISSKDGWDRLWESISVEIKVPGRQVVGILADANDHLTGRWNSIRTQLDRAGVSAGNPPLSQGLIVNHAPRVGVWLMPDNQSSGELEDFVIRMIPCNEKVWPLSQSYIDGIPLEDRRFSPGKKQRAQLYAWLATREEPRLMGSAIRTHDLEINGSLSQQFVGWLKRLFQ